MSDHPEVRGPFTQEASMKGRLIDIGCYKDRIVLYLHDGDTAYGCVTTRSIARAMAKHLFDQIRVFGTGRWVRDEDATCRVVLFFVHRFEALENSDPDIKEKGVAL